LTLGAVFGVTVGLVAGPRLHGPDNEMLSAFALAFLAGYGVEAVFSVMDRWLYRLREGDPEPSSPHSTGSANDAAGAASPATGS
jgi:hypothetical protein